jgi:very-short-patch-repair endonuclease
VPKTREREFRKLLSRQRGVFSAHQAIQLGADWNRLYRMCNSEEVTKILPRVYRLEGTARSYEQELVAAHLWAGHTSVISHRTAAALLGLCDRDTGRIEITSRRGLRSPHPKIVVYGRPPLPPVDVSRVHGLPVSTMPRTLIDMAAVSPASDVDWALDAAIRAGMPRDLFLERFSDLAARGRDGIALLRKLVAERTFEQELTESPFERRLLRLLRSAGLPLPLCQFVITDSGFTARVDFAYLDQRLIIEADSYRWHDGRAAFEHDRVRLSELASRGWRVLLITFLQLKYRPVEVVVRIRRALGL